MYIGLLEKQTMSIVKMNKLIDEAKDITRQAEAASKLAEKYLYEEKDEEKAKYYTEKVKDLVDRMLEIKDEALAIWYSNNF